jgi:hypothetical protein
VEVGGIEIDIRERGVVQPAVPERGDDLVKASADPRASDFEIPESIPRAATRSSTLRVETPQT